MEAARVAAMAAEIEAMDTARVAVLAAENIQRKVVIPPQHGEQQKSSKAVIDAISYPLRDITFPHEHDVLCGRGGGTNNHVGNMRWRMLVAQNKQLYVSLQNIEKNILSKSIVHVIRNQNPPGRFLRKDSYTGLWYDVGDQLAQGKTLQALRNGAKNIRSKLHMRGTPQSSI
jgi:hypothetical protein